MRVADTASRERGIDIVAEREAGTLAIEVKGFPSRGFADPRRFNEKKKAHPSAQATGWYGRAVLEAMLTWFSDAAGPAGYCIAGFPEIPRPLPRNRRITGEMRDRTMVVAKDGGVTLARQK